MLCLLNLSLNKQREIEREDKRTDRNTLEGWEGKEGKGRDGMCIILEIVSKEF
jgi:hypothetical protein